MVFLLSFWAGAVHLDDKLSLFNVYLFIVEDGLAVSRLPIIGLCPAMLIKLVKSVLPKGFELFSGTVVSVYLDVFVASVPR